MLAYNRNISIGKPRRLLFRVISLIVILHFIAVPGIHSQDKCKAALTEAQRMYDVGRSLEAIGLLTLCLPDDIPSEQRAKAYELLALAYVAEEALAEGKDSIEKMLDADKNYRPDASIHPAKFIELTQEAIDRRNAKKKRRKYLLYGGGGLAAAVVVAFLVFKGEEPPNPLPEPPPLPGDQ